MLSQRTSIAPLADSTPVTDPEPPAPKRRGRPPKHRPPPPEDREEPAAVSASALPEVDPEEAAAREQARKDLTSVKKQIHELTMKLLVAASGEVPVLTERLQRLRISMLMLREIVEDVVDPNSYKELALLKKMIDGAEPDEGEEEEQEKTADRERRERLANVGLNPDNAGSMVRVLRALEAAMTKPYQSPPEADDDQPPTGQPS